MSRTIVFILILCTKILVGQDQLAIDQAVINAHSDTSNYYVGDLVHYTIEHTINADEFKLDSIQGLLLISDQIDTLENSIQHQLSFLALDSGEVNLPAAQVRSGNTSYENEEIVIQVDILPEAEGVARAEDRELAEVPFSVKDWLKHYKVYIGIGALALILLYMLIRFLRRKPLSAKEPIAVSSKDWFEHTMKALARLKEEKLWEQDAKDYYVQIGDILRLYLSEQCGLPLTEQTTAESLSMLQNRWKEDWLQSYEFIMTRADFVKFAKGQMTVQDHLDCLSRAEQLVLSFKSNSDFDE
ncbi:hypothetical protein OAQ85_01960 [Schleiferiaceae bacterium]|nr:hypothetical protein [Schleiferiaceae bacterium]